jgi:folate-binding protein YgfZ
MFENLFSETIISQKSVVRVTGKDAKAFLQSQITQDINSLETESKFALVLEPDGKITNLFKITGLSDECYYLDTQKNEDGKLIKRLSKFKVRSKVEFETQSMTSFVSVAKNLTDKPDGIVYESNWSWADRFQFVEYFTCQPLHLDINSMTIEAFNVYLGLPNSADIVGHFVHEIPTLVGCAVSFNKGCYTGQEFVERIQSRGARVPQKLFKFKSINNIEKGPFVFNDMESGFIVNSFEYCGHYFGFIFLKRSCYEKIGTKANFGELEIYPLDSPEIF